MSFHVVIKPTGARCNLDCRYCFYLQKEDLYPGSSFRMTAQVQEAFLNQLEDGAFITWQGGEPTMMGLEFFRKAAELTGGRVTHALQTNGLLLTDEWCQFLAEHGFLVGLSIDGPEAMHDAYRLDRGQAPTFGKVQRALRMLQKHGVDYNLLTCVHAANADHPSEVYRFLREEGRHIQFLPIVERDQPYSVQPEQWGGFLKTVFDEWIDRDVGQIYIQAFDAALASWVGVPPGICIFRETCGDALALEHNGDLYSCDHFVAGEHRLGNVLEQTLEEMVASQQQRGFGLAKRDTLPDYCKQCDVRFACHGECPKNRFALTPDGEPGLNYLCAGYKAFFTHISPAMKVMANLFEQQRPPAHIMELRRQAFAQAGRNDACPCGSGLKFKRCHGRNS